MIDLTQLLTRFLRSEVCSCCSREWQSGHGICNVCEEILPKVSNACVVCGLANRAIEAHPVCPTCLINPPAWQAMYSPYHYSGQVRHKLLQAKFSNQLAPLNELCQSHAPFDRDWQSLPEVLIPVPLHSERLRQRGFNQAEEIANFWSQRFAVPVDRKILKRVKTTNSQSGLTAPQRLKNVKRAFNCADNKYRHVALVDDIVTTGATVGELTRLLHRSGVEFVEIWAVARACRKDRMR